MSRYRFINYNIFVLSLINKFRYLQVKKTIKQTLVKEEFIHYSYYIDIFSLKQFDKLISLLDNKNK